MTTPKTCKRGHVKTPENTSSKGSCRECVREQTKVYKRRMKVYHDYRQDDYAASKALAPVKPKPKPVRSQAEQERLDRAQRDFDRMVDNKYRVDHSQIKIYQHGTPEFDEMCKQVTPLNRIRTAHRPQFVNLVHDL